MGYVVLAVLLVLTIQYWYISVPVLALTAIAVGVTVHRQNQRQHEAAGVAPIPVKPPALQPQRRTPALTMPADTFKVGSLVHLEKDGTRATYFVDHGRTPDEIVLKRVTSAPRTPDPAADG